MNNQHYCNEKANKPGTTFYYAAKTIPLAQRNAIIAIQAFYLEIEEIIFHFSDLGVAQARLNWWREEVIKIHNGHPAHPVSQCLQQHKISPEKLFAMIEGLEQNLAYLSFHTVDEVVVHWMRTAGEREKLFAEVLGLSIDDETLYHAMLVIELSHYLQFFRKYVERDLLFFSEDELAKYNVQRSDFQNLKTTLEMQALFAFQVEKLQRAYEKAFNLMRDKSFFAVRMEMARLTINEIANSRYLILENFIELTPLRRWWITKKFLFI